jgi:adenine-specific DNA-methyltransferase
METLFKTSKKFTDKEGKLFIPKILEAIEKIDSDLIKLLLSDKKAKEQFFIKVEDVYVLNQNDLIEFFTMNEYFDHSFTSYTNKIGLIKKDSFIKKFDDVVLAFPYKDCVLEGGQTKDEQKKKEIFYNAIISRDEIDRLFEPKVLTNVKRYDKEGKHSVEEIKEDDNLIIKGNNLLALHSLKKRYAGRVKLIYIDPPYNTENDSFQYNDSFTHSTWLTFIKNRLEVAREFLSDDGILFIHLDNNEESYLKVLCDEIFGRDNYLNTIAVRSSTASGMKTAHRERTIIKQKDFILTYKKTKNISLNPQYMKKEKWDTHYSYMLDKKNMKILKLKDVLLEKGILSDKETLNDLDIQNKDFVHFYIKHKDEIFQTAPELPVEIKKLSKEKKDEIIPYGEEKNINYAINGRRLTFLSKTLKPIYYNQKIEEDLATLLCDFWDDIDFQNTQNEGGVPFPNGKKPELLLYRIISLTTNANDIVMDFHLGSGTTCAVAHKMGRRYIGIEQMDYIEDIAVERIKKVIDGEQGGISKALNWQGGGSFVYAELKEIDNFLNTPIAKLNKNMQYLPISEIEDEEYSISSEEIKLNKKFYGLDNE